jgi:glycosyltransferase involved in cell wall biosynthesis
VAVRAPDVTVVIPTRDRCELLTRTLRRVLSQEGVTFDAVVVDDGSLDGTSARLGSMDEPRLRCVRHHASRGVAHARNSGLAEARGRWVAFLDDDDLWSPRKLADQIVTGERVEAAFIFSSVLAVEASGRLRPYHAPAPHGLVRRLLMENVIPAGSSNVLARTDMVRRLGGFDDRLHSLADWDMWIRLARAGPAARCSEIHVAYVEHDQNMHHRPVDMTREVAILAEKYSADCLNLGITFARAHLDSSSATELLQRDQRWGAARALLRASTELRDPELAARATAALLGPRAKRFARRAWYGTIQPPPWLMAALAEEPAQLPPEAEHVSLEGLKVREPSP